MSKSPRDDRSEATPARSFPKGAGISPELVARLTESMLNDPRSCHLGPSRLPSPDSVEELVGAVRDLVFPGFFGRRGLTEATLPVHVAALVGMVQSLAQEQIHAVLRYIEHLERVRGTPTKAFDDCDARAWEVAQAVVGRLPELRRLLSLDVQAAYDGDPAALHTDETVICYPGVHAILAHRLAHEFYTLDVPLLPRMISEMAHARTGIDIHPGARIGESFFIDHGGGVVIGETTVIGRSVRIYQGVTLGAKSFEKDAHGRLVKGKRRHPTIGDRVTIYAGAVILGGETVVGDDCVIGGGVFVTESVPAGHVVRQKPPELLVRAAGDAQRGGGLAWYEDWVI